MDANTFENVCPQDHEVYDLPVGLEELDKVAKGVTTTAAEKAQISYLTHESSQIHKQLKDRMLVRGPFASSAVWPPARCPCKVCLCRRPSSAVWSPARCPCKVCLCRQPASSWHKQALHKQSLHSSLCISSLCICTAPRAACVQEAFKERAASIVDAEPELQAATFDHKPGVNANTEYRELLERVWKKCDPARAPMQSNAQSHNSFPNDEVA